MEQLILQSIHIYVPDFISEWKKSCIYGTLGGWAVGGQWTFGRHAHGRKKFQRDELQSILSGISNQQRTTMIVSYGCMITWRSFFL